MLAIVLNRKCLPTVASIWLILHTQRISRMFENCFKLQKNQIKTGMKEDFQVVSLSSSSFATICDFMALSRVWGWVKSMSFTMFWRRNIFRKLDFILKGNETRDFSFQIVKFLTRKISLKNDLKRWKFNFTLWIERTEFRFHFYFSSSVRRILNWAR